MQLFKIDGPLFRFLEKIANLMILNIVFIICSLPIVTIGPALTAMYYVNMKMVRGEDTGIIRSFFHSFRLNFKQGFGIGIGVILLAGLLLVDIHALTYLVSIPEAIAKILLAAVVILLIILVMIAIYLFAILAQFDNKTKELIKWSAIISVRHFPVTLISALIVAIPVFVFLKLPGIFIQIVLPLMLLMGFSGITFLQSYFYVRVFNYYIPKDEETTEED